LRHVWALAVLTSPATVIIAAANAAKSPNIPKRMMHLPIRITTTPAYRREGDPF